MRIDNGLNKYNTTYKGVLKNSTDLQKSIEKASDYELHRLGKNLKRMNKVDDGRVFSLDWFSFTSPFTVRKDIRLISSVNGENYKSQIVGQEYVKRNKKSHDKCYNDVIKNTNEILETIYPEEKTTRAKRENSINTILKYLDKK